MKVVIFGATGLIGHGALLEALDSTEVSSVLTVGRRKADVEHEKLRQVIHEDFEDFSAIADELSGVDACFWCLGISSAGVDEATYTKITHDYTMAAAEALHEKSPNLTFCFVSGQGTDANARTMWARVKGKAERALSEKGFARVHHFRPGFIRPMRGAQSRTRLYRLLNPVVRLFYPTLRALGGATSTVEIGRAMVEAAQGRVDVETLDSRTINRFAGIGEQPDFLRLFIALATILALGPAAIHFGRYGEHLVNGLLLVNVLFAVRTISDSRSVRIGVRVLALAVFASLPLARTFGLESPRLIGQIAYLAFFLTVTVQILKHVFKGSSVNGNDIFGALCVYLLAAVAFGLAYTIHIGFIPDAFVGHESELELFYFSLVTITTVGYGDIVPNTPLSQSLAGLEAAFGQLYLAVLIAWLIGLRVRD